MSYGAVSTWVATAVILALLIAGYIATSLRVQHIILVLLCLAQTWQETTQGGLG